jgi:vacuolar protein sorting-associated protein 53
MAPSPVDSKSPKRSPGGKAAARAPSTPLLTKANIPQLPLSKDPAALLDSLLEQQNRPKDAPPFDPIEFLNKHYETEQSLSQQLPILRDSVAGRMDKLNERISSALQRQSETAVSTRQYVQDAKASVTELERRILQVKEKAKLSEKAVLEITADMKRLDCAKRHLQRTITTLKRLHMLVHAVEQLRLTVQERPFADYRTASHLVEAVDQLLQHFAAYAVKVQPMRVLAGKVTEFKKDLHTSLVKGFRVVAFGYQKTMLLEGKKQPVSRTSSTGEQGEEQQEPQEHPPVMSVSILQGGVLFIDSLGNDVRARFIHEFCEDQLGSYLKEFEPPDRTVKPERRVSSFKMVEVHELGKGSKAGLDNIDKRYTWFLNGPIKSIGEKFPRVFPDEWNVQASMAAMFLQLVSAVGVFFLVSRRVQPIFCLKFFCRGIFGLVIDARSHSSLVGRSKKRSGCQQRYHFVEGFAEDDCLRKGHYSMA